MSKKFKNLQRLGTFLSFGILPVLLRSTSDFVLGFQIKFIDYYSEIYIFNAFIFAYAYSCFNKNFIKKLSMAHVSAIFFASTLLYSYKSVYSNLELKLIFSCSIALTLLNLIFTVFMVITAQENNADSDKHEDSSGIYSENRYIDFYLGFLTICVFN